MVVGTFWPNINNPEKRKNCKNTGHSKKSVVVGISGKSIIICKKVKIEKDGTFYKFAGSWNFRPNIDNPEKR